MCAEDDAASWSHYCSHLLSLQLHQDSSRSYQEVCALKMMRPRGPITVATCCHCSFIKTPVGHTRRCVHRSLSGVASSSMKFDLRRRLNTAANVVPRDLHCWEACQRRLAGSRLYSGLLASDVLNVKVCCYWLKYIYN